MHFFFVAPFQETIVVVLHLPNVLVVAGREGKGRDPIELTLWVDWPVVGAGECPA